MMLEEGHTSSCALKKICSNMQIILIKKKRKKEKGDLSSNVYFISRYFSFKNYNLHNKLRNALFIICV